MGERDLVETGIKPIDLFAPIRHGDLVRWDAGFGCGHVACLAELTRNLLGSGYRGAVWTGFENEHVNERELRQALSQLGERDLVTLMLAPGAAAPEERREHLRRVGEEVDALRAGEPGRYLVVWYQDEAQLEDAASAFPALNRPGESAVTAICATPVRFPAAPAEPVELELRLRARVVHDLRLVQRRMFPAIDGLLTTSANLTPDVVGAGHAGVAAEARDLLERYGELDPDLDFPDLFVFPRSERVTVTRGQRLYAFLTQAFKVSEAFSGMPGECVPLERTLQGVRGLLAGELDDVPFGEVLYSGRLPRPG